MNINITKLIIPTHQTAYIVKTQLIIIKTRLKHKQRLCISRIHAYSWIYKLKHHRK